MSSLEIRKKYIKKFKKDPVAWRCGLTVEEIDLLIIQALETGKPIPEEVLQPWMKDPELKRKVYNGEVDI